MELKGSFEQEFPNLSIFRLDKPIFWRGNNYQVALKKDIREHCLDKQKVKQAIESVEGDRKEFNKFHEDTFDKPLIEIEEDGVIEGVKVEKTSYDVGFKAGLNTGITTIISALKKELGV